MSKVGISWHPTKEHKEAYLTYYRCTFVTTNSMDLSLSTKLHKLLCKFFLKQAGYTDFSQVILDSWRYWGFLSGKEISNSRHIEDVVCKPLLLAKHHTANHSLLPLVGWETERTL